MEEDDRHSRSRTRAPGCAAASAYPTSAPSIRMAAAIPRSTSTGGGSSAGIGGVHRRGTNRRRCGAREPRDDRRVRGERDHVAGRQGAVVLLHGEVLVHHAPAVEQREPHDGALLDADGEDDRAHAVGELPREPGELARVAVRRVVVDADPAVPRRREHRATRAAREPRDELTHGTLDRGRVVRLDMDGAEGACDGPERDPLLELGTRRDQHELIVGEAPARVGRAGRRIARRQPPASRTPRPGTPRGPRASARPRRRAGARRGRRRCRTGA